MFSYNKKHTFYKLKLVAVVCCCERSGTGAEMTIDEG